MYFSFVPEHPLYVLLCKPAFQADKGAVGVVSHCYQQLPYASVLHPAEQLHRPVLVAYACQRQVDARVKLGYAFKELPLRRLSAVVYHHNGAAAYVVHCPFQSSVRKA